MTWLSGLGNDMVEKNDRIWVIYPEYFDSGITRKLGRRLRKEMAQPSPTLDELFACAHKLDLSPVKEADVAYPSFWWQKRGRLLVRKEWSKTETLEHLAQEYAEYRKVHGMPGAKEESSKESGKRDYHKGGKRTWKDRKKTTKAKKGKRNK